MPVGVTIQSVGAGYAHSCALSVAGAVYCWGRNVFGEVGDGTTTDRHIATPIASPAGVTFLSVAVGFVHACVLTAEGAAYCWGVNTGGRLGDGTATNRLVPVKVVQD
jgi:alpha-tubulin suppressor-like RCC1 family protein